MLLIYATLLRNGVIVHLTQLLISLQTHPQLEKFVQQHCHIPTIQLNSRHLPSLVPPVPWLNPSAGMYLRQTGESGRPRKLLLEFKLTYSSLITVLEENINKILGKDISLMPN